MRVIIAIDGKCCYNFAIQRTKVRAHGHHDGDEDGGGSRRLLGGPALARQPTCLCCGVERIYKMKDYETGECSRHLRWHLRDRNGSQGVRTALIMESCGPPPTAWVSAFSKACASKKGIATLQLPRELYINYKSALFLLSRIHFAVTPWPSEGPEAKMGAAGRAVEAEETCAGGKHWYKDTSKRGRVTKQTPVFAMVEGRGQLRMQVVKQVTVKDFGTIVDQNLNVTVRLIIDDFAVYRPIGPNHLGGHEAVKHGQCDDAAKSGPVGHSTTVESALSLLRRGVYATYHFISRHRFPCYRSAFQFRWYRHFADYGERTLLAVERAEGRRLVYRTAET